MIPEIWASCGLLCVKENVVYIYIYKVTESKFIILVLYVNEILLTNNDVGLLYKTKQTVSKTFEMKDLAKASFLLIIVITKIYLVVNWFVS